ncbi:MAG: YiiX/YebB-like N1pC/P60 family cysteine hydrolase [Bacteroidetes bacterium]|nr:YiiX/YebB-like N1pC/P60 family cysteine hydrolase [Bacteroidota bacterium]
MIAWSPKFLYYFTPLIRVSKYIKWRFGRKYRCSELDLNQVRELLKPGMILLSRREFEISNYFIDGYWTHTAMVMPDGKVIQATSGGVVINTIGEFFTKTDDFVILRPRFCGVMEMEKACCHASEKVGTPYSFDFNNSDDTLYCSELILKAYAKTCGWNKKSQMEPVEFKTLCDGKIVHPSKLYNNRNAWEVVFQLN